MSVQETVLTGPLPGMMAENPFPGLRPFNTNEKHLFFGRDGLSDTLLEKLKATRLVAVVGTSGSGKSSLIRAGLLPALRGGFLTGAGSSWRVALFRPINNPIGNLACSLVEDGKMTTANAPEDQDEKVRLVEATLRSSSLGLVEVVREARLAPHENLLVVADQFEELYRFEPGPEVGHPKDEASAFVRLLLEATRQVEIPIYVILTMRSDYLGDSAHFWGLPEAINRGQFLIPRMDDDERREAIEGPVRVRGARISWPLVNRLLNDAGDDPRQLPILQHALMRTWDYWEKHLTTSEPLGIHHYDNEEVGGVDCALSIHADEAFEELTEEQRVIAEKMFKRLTEKGAGKREGRLPGRVVELTEITNAEEAEILQVIEVFRKDGRSFLMPPVPKPLNADTLIDISHESLISGWGRLSQWVEQEADSAKMYGRLVDDALRYPEETALLTNPELPSALDWRERQRPNEAWAKRYLTEYGKGLASDNPPRRPTWAEPDATEFGIAMKYLDLSQEARDRAEAQRERKRRRSVVRLAVAAGIFLALALVALGYSGVARREKSNALAATQQALAAQRQAVEGEQRAEASQREAESLRQEADRQRGEIVVAYELAESQRKNALQSAREAERLRAKAVAAQKGLEVQAKRGNLLEEGISSAMNGDVKTAVGKLEEVGKIYVDRSKKALTEVLIGDIILKSKSEGANAIRHESALTHYQRALAAGGDAIFDAPIFVKIGDNITSSNLDKKEAIPYYRHGIGMMGAEKDQRSKLNTLIKLGEVEEQVNAASVYEQALKLSQVDPATTIKIYMRLGAIYHATDKVKEAEVAYDNALEIVRRSGDPVAEGNALAKIGDRHFEADQSFAVKFYARAHSAYRIDSTKSPTVVTLLNDARVLKVLAESARHVDGQAAIKYYELELKRYQAAVETPGSGPERDRIRRRIAIMMDRVRENIVSLKPFIISHILLKTILERDIASGITQYLDLKENCANKYVITEESLNRLGYELLRNNKVKEAIEIFKLNVEAYPQGWNTYDSLGEGYMIAGNKELAILYYEKSLKLNPDNKVGIEALKKLRSK